jgi:LysR family hca operon transcriptional activator
MLPKQHPFAKFEEIKLEQLKELELTILSNKLSQPLSKTILQYIEFNKIQFKTIHETNHIVDCIQAVNSGVSCAILPSYMEALATDQVIVKPLAKPLPSLDVFMAFNKNPPIKRLNNFWKRFDKYLHLINLHFMQAEKKAELSAFLMFGLKHY